jgi:hypothetical protein
MAQSIIDDDDDLEAQRKRAASAQEFSYETIQADPWTAVYFGIPRTADAALLRYAYDAAMQCCGSSIGPDGTEEVDELQFERAVRRLDELGYRLRPPMLDDEAERQAPEQQPTPEIAPEWRQVENDWRMIVGNETVAVLIPNSDERFPQYEWLSLIVTDDYPEHGWHAVDFETLEGAQHTLEQWWHHARKGEAYRPETHDKEPIVVEAANHNDRETMTIEAIEREPWIAVHYDIPPDASRDLLSLVATTARDLHQIYAECRDAARNGRAIDRETLPEYLRDFAEILPQIVTVSEMLDLGQKAADRQEDAEYRLLKFDQRTSGPVPEKEPMTAEAIERDPRNAIDLDIPPDASRELLSLVATTAENLRGTTNESMDDLSTKEVVAELSALSEAAEARRDEALLALERRARREAANAPEFSRETIATDPWTAVYLPIPQAADEGLLRHAHGMAMQCCGAVAGPAERLSLDAFWPSEGGLGADKTREENFEQAVRRLDELDSRLRPAMLDDEAARQAAPEKEPAAEKQAPRETLDEMVERHRDEYELVHGAYGVEELPSQLAARHERELARLKAELENERDSFVIGAPDGTETHDPEEWRLQNPKAAQELAELEAWLEPAQEKEQSDKAKLAEEILFDLSDGHSHYYIDRWEGGYAVFRTYEIDDAMLAEYRIPTDLQKLGDAETLPELHQAIIDGSALAVVPLWITDAEREREIDTAAERRDHMTDYASYAGREISERSPLADDRGGDEISRPLGAAELAERVRRILENPILADAERDDRVLQAVEERREELGFVDSARSDDTREVESSQEAEPEATADRDAAEIDYLFGREEMTEARAAAYDRFTGQELSPRTGQTAGQVQDVGQSQSQSKGRSR